MGLSSSTQKTTQNSTQNVNQTVTPTAPSYLTGAVQDYVTGIQNFASGDPTARVAPASQLQQQAFKAANDLGGWQDAANAASQAAGAAGNAPAAQAGSTNATAYTYQAPTIANVAAANAQTYSTPGAGTAGQAATTNAADLISQYQNPYQQQVIDATLADMDQQAGATRAAQLAAGARNKALGGSRFAIAQALTEDQLQRARATEEANLRSQGFTTAASLAANDAAQRNQAAQFNTGQANQFSLADASLRDQAARYAADANNQFQMFNIGNDWQRALQQASLSAQAGQFNAGQQTGVSQFNAGASNQAALANASLQEQAKARALQAALGQADIANQSATNARADTALQADLGAQQRQITTEQNNADLAQLLAQGQLLGMTPYQILVGQNVTGTTTGTGTSTTRSDPGLMGLLNFGLGAGSLFL